MDSKIRGTSEINSTRVQYPKREQSKKEHSHQEDHKSHAALKSYQNQSSNDHTHSLRAKDIASFDLYTLRENLKCADALKLMTDHNIHHLPILDDNNKVKGVVTDRDILSKSRFEGVKNHMNTKYKQIDENLKLGAIIKSFVEGGVSVLTLYSHGKLGLITHSDVIEALYRNRTLEIYV